MPIFDYHLQQLIAQLLIGLKEHIHISSGIIRKDFWTYWIKFRYFEQYPH